MSMLTTLWPKFREKKLREEFVAQFSRQAIPAQIAALMKQHGLSQTQLATRSGLTQGVISRAADPSYGKLTIRTLVRIAAGLDVAFMPVFVPFSELPKWFDRLETDEFTVLTFDEEDAALTSEPALVTGASSFNVVRFPTLAFSPMPPEGRKPPKRAKQRRFLLGHDVGANTNA